MPSRASKRVKRTTKATQAPESLKSEDGHQDTSSSVSNLGGAVRSHDEKPYRTTSTAPSTPPTEYTKSSGPSKKRKQDQIDSDSEYETIKVLKGDANVRNPTELPIIATTSTGERKVLWAKMDTGADVNIIAEKLVHKLGRAHEIEPVPTSTGLTVHEVGGNEIAIDRKITLSFSAGRKSILCKDVEFWIPQQDGVDTDKDGVPDVLLSLPELIKYHMVMVDPDFCNEPEDGLEVLAKRARDEAEKPAICCLPTKYPQIEVRGR